MSLRQHVGTLGRSGAASLLASGSEVGVLFVMQAVGLPLVAAFALVQLIGTTITFTLNKYWVFGAGGSGHVLAEGGKAIVVFAGSFTLNSVLPSVGAYGLHLSPLLAYAISQVAAYAFWSFPLNRWWVFPVRLASPQPAG